MERKLIHYLPYVVREIAEFKGIATGEQPEFELAWERAAELLRETDMSVAEIAAAVGYESQGKFTAAFKNQFAALPTAYRKQG